MRIETGNPDFNYELVCNKICGWGHFGMKYIIVVDEPDEFDAWYAAQDPWLKQNANYLSEVPDMYKDAASIVAGIVNEGEENNGLLNHMGFLWVPPKTSRFCAGSYRPANTRNPQLRRRTAGTTTG